MGPVLEYLICHNADRVAGRAAQALAEPLRSGAEVDCHVYSQVLTKNFLQDDGGTMEQILLLLVDDLRPTYLSSDPRVKQRLLPMQLSHRCIRDGGPSKVTEDLLWKARRVNAGPILVEHGEARLILCDCENALDVKAYVDRGLIVAPPMECLEHVVHLWVPGSAGTGHLTLTFRRNLWIDVEDSYRSTSKLQEGQDHTVFVQSLDYELCDPAVVVAVPRAEFPKHWAVDPRRFAVKRPAFNTGKIVKEEENESEDDDMPPLEDGTTNGAGTRAHLSAGACLHPSHGRSQGYHGHEAQHEEEEDEEGLLNRGHEPQKEPKVDKDHKIVADVNRLPNHIEDDEDQDVSLPEASDSGASQAAEELQGEVSSRASNGGGALTAGLPVSPVGILPEGVHTKGAVQLSDLKNIHSGLGSLSIPPTVRQERDTGPTLSEVIRPKRILPLLKNPAVQERLAPHLPEGLRNPREMRELVQSPQFQQQVETFSSMGDPSKEVTEEDRIGTIAAKAEAMQAMAEGGSFLSRTAQLRGSRQRFHAAAKPDTKAINAFLKKAKEEKSSSGAEENGGGFTGWGAAGLDMSKLVETAPEQDEQANAEEPKEETAAEEGKQATGRRKRSDAERAEDERFVKYVEVRRELLDSDWSDADESDDWSDDE